MVTTRIPAPPTEANPHEPTPEFILRGRGLFATYRDELCYLGGGSWLVPSGSTSGKAYVVRVGVARPDRCECRGFASHGHCSHVVCASIAHKKSAVCDSCGERHYWPELIEVTEDHASLTWFVGDVVCRRCARGTDIL